MGIATGAAGRSAEGGYPFLALLIFGILPLRCRVRISIENGGLPASGKPILIFGPQYSSLVRYAKEQGFAEVVEHFDENALVRGMVHILSDSIYRSELCKRSLAVFEQNHNIVRQRKD